MRERTSGERFVSCVYVASSCSGNRAARAAFAAWNSAMLSPKRAGSAADLVERGEPEVAVERRVLDALRHHGPGRLLEADDEVLVPRLLQEEDAPQLLADVRPADLDAVELVDAPA